MNQLPAKTIGAYPTRGFQNFHFNYALPPSPPPAHPGKRDRVRPSPPTGGGSAALIAIDQFRTIVRLARTIMPVTQWPVTSGASGLQFACNCPQIGPINDAMQAAMTGPLADQIKAMPWARPLYDLVKAVWNWNFQYVDRKDDIPQYLSDALRSAGARYPGALAAFDIGYCIAGLSNAIIQKLGGLVPTPPTGLRGLPAKEIGLGAPSFLERVLGVGAYPTRGFQNFHFNYALPPAPPPAPNGPPPLVAANPQPLPSLPPPWQAFARDLQVAVLAVFGNRPPEHISALLRYIGTQTRLGNFAATRNGAIALAREMFLDPWPVTPAVSRVLADLGGLGVGPTGAAGVGAVVATTAPSPPGHATGANLSSPPASWRADAADLQVAVLSMMENRPTEHISALLQYIATQTRLGSFAATRNGAIALSRALPSMTTRVQQDLRYLRVPGV